MLCRFARRRLVKSFILDANIISPARYSQSSRLRFVYQPIEEVEKLEGYQPGGYHPINIGDCLNERYKIVHKLGHGSYSTIWLARDTQLTTFVAVKVGTADSNQQEVNILSRIANSAINVKYQASNFFPPVLDRFTLRGPNGTHFCYTTCPARCSLADTKEASNSALFPLDVARALATQLILAVALIHDHGYVHGDLHLGNILVHLPSSLEQYSDEQLYEKFGAPEPEQVTRLDGKPLAPGVPSHVFSPVWLGKPSEEMEPSDAKLLLIDFGVAFQPAQTGRLQSFTPLDMRPPEARFEPNTPLSFPSDIWTLGNTIWSIVGQRALLDSFLLSQDDVTSDQVDALGRLPTKWWEKWEARTKRFTEEGKPVEGRSVWTWHQRFEDSIQEPRRVRGMETMEREEEVAFREMMRLMLVFDPQERVTVKQVLESDWMRQWALPAYEKMQA